MCVGSSSSTRRGGRKASRPSRSSPRWTWRRGRWRRARRTAAAGRRRSTASSWRASSSTARAGASSPRSGTRTVVQVRSHTQTYFQKLAKAKAASATPPPPPPASDSDAASIPSPAASSPPRKRARRGTAGRRSPPPRRRAAAGCAGRRRRPRAPPRRAPPAKRGGNRQGARASPARAPTKAPVRAKPPAKSSASLRPSLLHRPSRRPTFPKPTPKPSAKPSRSGASHFGTDQRRRRAQCPEASLDGVDHGHPGRGTPRAALRRRSRPGLAGSPRAARRARHETSEETARRRLRAVPPLPRAAGQEQRRVLSNWMGAARLYNAAVAALKTAPSHWMKERCSGSSQETALHERTGPAVGKFVKAHVASKGASKDPRARHRDVVMAAESNQAKAGDRRADKAATKAQWRLHFQALRPHLVDDNGRSRVHQAGHEHTEAAHARQTRRRARRDRAAHLDKRNALPASCGRRCCSRGGRGGHDGAVKLTRCRRGNFCTSRKDRGQLHPSPEA